MSKKAITIRMDADLLAFVRRQAAADNRTLTNYIETVLKQAAVPSAVAVNAVAPSLAVTLPDPSSLAVTPILVAVEPPADAVICIDTGGVAGEA